MKQFEHSSWNSAIWNGFTLYEDITCLSLSCLATMEHIVILWLSIYYKLIVTWNNLIFRYIVIQPFPCWLICHMRTVKLKISLLIHSLIWELHYPFICKIGVHCLINRQCRSNIRNLIWSYIVCILHVTKLSFEGKELQSAFNPPC